MKYNSKIIIISIAILAILAGGVIVAYFLLNPPELKTSPNFTKNLTEEQRVLLEERKKKQLEFIKEFPTYYEVYLDLGNIEKELSNYRQALKYYDKASEIIPSSAIPLLNKAAVYVETGLLEKAEQEYLKAQKASPDYYLIYLQLADFYKNHYQEKKGEIENVYLLGIQETNNDPELLTSYGNWLIKNNRLADSKQVWEKILNINPLDQQAAAKLSEVEEAMDLAQ